MSSTKPTKRPYATPALVAYGAVQDLTAGGSGATSEWELKEVNNMGVKTIQCVQTSMAKNLDITPFC